MAVPRQQLRLTGGLAAACCVRETTLRCAGGCGSGSDAPLPDELVVVLAVSAAERPHARIGQGADNTFLVPKP